MSRWGLNFGGNKDDCKVDDDDAEEEEEEEEA
jgi:hypothetical protein